jgi:hypothetical protein
MNSPQDDKSLEKVLIKSKLIEDALNLSDKPLPKEIDYPYTGEIVSINNEKKGDGPSAH